LDLTTNRSTLRNFDALGYPQLVQTIRNKGLPERVLGENWLRMMDVAKVP
jgi:hypothetical protein